MDQKVLLSHVDHTLLRPTATKEDIRVLCDEGLRYRTASVCIPPCYVSFAKSHLQNALPVCTVIGFPNGYNSAAVKQFETERALQDGADEIDTVIPLGALKAGDTDAVLEELRALKRVCGDKILKVIIETCLLTEQEKITMCRIVSEAGADYIKTSTGFSTGGATDADILLFKRHIAPTVKIKAAGGIASLADAERFLALGADRLGTSKIVKLIQQGEGKNEISDAAY